MLIDLKKNQIVSTGQFVVYPFCLLLYLFTHERKLI